MRRTGLSITVATSIAVTTALASACRQRPSFQNAGASDPRPHSAQLAFATQDAAPAPPAVDAPSSPPTLGPGFPARGPWVSFYGSAAEMGDLAKVARTYRIINIDADPGANNFTNAQIEILKAGGRNRVLSYFNVGACEHYRTYWAKAPPGVVSCSANRAAQRGAYEGYPEETWMDPGEPGYQSLLLDHVAPRLAARVDGFYLDNLEILEHPAMSSNGPCSSSCRQGGLDFVRMLRERYPAHLIVMQNATSEVTRLGKAGDVRFATLLDGIAHEEVYAPKYDSAAEAELLAWKGMGLATRSGLPFWIAVEDYAGTCHNRDIAHRAMGKARAHELSSYVSDESGGQKTVCYWD